MENLSGRKAVLKAEREKGFKVNPKGIDQGLFQEKRSDRRQEKVRILILEAFSELKIHPETYGAPFTTKIPEKIWDGYKSVVELEEIATHLGGQISDWVEQALEWAQHISNHNGNDEAWNEICNDADSADWYRLIKWKDDYKRIGGSRKRNNEHPASHIGSSYKYHPVYRLDYTVPLLTFRG